MNLRRDAKRQLSARTCGRVVVGLLLAWWMAGAWAAGRRSEGERDTQFSAFFEGPVQRWEISLPRDSVDALLGSPREYVRATVRVG